jgi:AraC family transcriptional regulator
LLKAAKFSRLFPIEYFFVGTAMDFPSDREPLDISDLDELRILAVPDAEIVGLSKMGNSAQVTIYQLPPMATPFYVVPYHAFSMALSDLPSLELSTDGLTFQPHPIGTGEWIFIPHAEISGSRWLHDSLCMHVYLEPSFVSNLISTNFAAEKVLFKPLIGCEDPIVKNLLELFKQEFALNGLTDLLYTEALATALSLHLIRTYADRQPSETVRAVYSHQSQLDEAIDYIERNLEREITVQALAERARLSISVFAHSFKKIMGISPYQFIITKRLERAIELLLDRDVNLPISKICQMCGFSSSSAFATRFRQKYGISPAKYRSNNLDITTDAR